MLLFHGVYIFLSRRINMALKKICLQAGHGGASGGAPSERDWNVDIVAKMKEILKGRYEVYTTGKNADKDTTVTKTDWDIFLAVHYDADIYNDTGGFVDFPEPSTDFSTEKSQKYAKAISDYYFKSTGIKNKPNRSNANTRYYYMWKSLSAKTPCVLIECGVGWRKPEDYTRLRKGDIPQILSDAIVLALGDTPSNPCEKQLKEVTESRDKLLADFSAFKESSAKEIKSITDKLNESEKALGDLKKANERLVEKLDKTKKELDKLVASL